MSASPRVSTVQARGISHRLPSRPSVDNGSQPSGRLLYEDLSFDAWDGSITAVVGPNGAGKTTLLKEVAGVASPQQGSVSLSGEDLLSIAAKERARRIAYLPQRTTTYYPLSVFEVARLGRLPFLSQFGQWSKEDDDATFDALEEVQIAHLADRPIEQLSGGERQRALLARLLATQCPVLVLDEPTTALDVGQALRFFRLAQNLRDEGRTLIVAMHELNLAAEFADDVICIHGDNSGRVSVGTADQTLTPATIAQAFGVDVQHSDRALHFSLPKQEGS